ENENADDRDEHVLKHDAVRNRRAAHSEQRRYVPHPDRECQIRDDEEQHSLPERMAEYLPKTRHFLFARKVTNASNWPAVSICPKVAGIVPANFSYPFVVSLLGLRIFLRIDAAVRRLPT